MNKAAKILGILLAVILAIFIFGPMIFFAVASSGSDLHPLNILGLLIPCAALLGGLFFAMESVKRAARMAFSDPEDRNYVRKTDRQLYSFVLSSSIAALVLSVLSFQIFIYIALLWWFIYIIFMCMFSRVWKFHGKKQRHLVGIVALTIVVSFFAAPFIRMGIGLLMSH